MNQAILKNMIAEWLEEFALPILIPRDAAPAPADLRNLSEILAIVGPRRAGKTFVMYPGTGTDVSPLLDVGRSGTRPTAVTFTRE